VTRNPHGTTAAASRPNRRAGMQWPALVVGMLVLNMGICAVTIVAAVRTNPAVVPDYYDKALRWDELRTSGPEAPRADPAAAAPGAPSPNNGTRP